MAKKPARMNNPFQKPKRFTVAPDLKISAENHDALVEHVKERAQWGDQIRNVMVDHFAYLDRQLFGHIKLDEDDKKRQRDNYKGKPPQPVDVNLQLIWSQIDDAVTDLLAIVIPDGGTYGAVASGAQQDKAQGVARKMNNDAAEFQHYDNYAMAAFQMFSKNFGGFVPEWEIKFGNKLTKGPAAEVQVEHGVPIYSGNAVWAIDPYNTILDPSVDPIKVHSEGEFFITVERHTSFRVQKMEQDNEIFDAVKYLNDGIGTETTLYREKPTLDFVHTTHEVQESWSEILTMQYGDKTFNRGHEFWTFRGWINPKQFGLSPTDGLEIWEIVIMHGRYVVAVNSLGNNHGKLPICIGMPCRSGLGQFEPSFGMKLLPLQQFASFSLNQHQKASRKALYGLTFYDQRLASFIDNADMLGGKIPVKLSGVDMDIRKVVYQTFDAPQTERTMENITATDALAQKILPTDFLKQIASLERATKYQAAATVQAANRRSYKNAKVLDSQAFRTARIIQFYNLIQYGEEIKYIDETGKESTFPTSDLIDTFEPDALASDSLRGLDKLVVIEFMTEILHMSFQNAQAFQNMDLLKMIDYIATLIGDKTDYSQFRVQSPMDNMTPEMKQMAFQLLQQHLQQRQAGEAKQEAGQLPQQAVGNNLALVGAAE